MKTKLVLWGRDAQDERVLIALQLRPQENKVDLYTFSESIATEDFSQKMLNEWRNGEELTFPEGHSHQEKELSVTEGLLPEDLKVERGDLIQRAQTEWHFIVLSSKLNETYQTELGEIKEKVEQLSSYSGEVWEELKIFWSKVQGQVRERNLFREHADDLKNSTNDLFGKMKDMRKVLDKEFQTVSEDHVKQFKGHLGEVKERLEKGLNLNGIFEDLKNIQKQFRESKLTREHRSSVWDQLDGLFKEVKARRYGGDANAGNNTSPSERLKRRYDGLMNALSKMDQSINRDKRDLEFQDRRAGNSVGQLEAQLREAKIMMINERIRSKEEKKNDMLKTKAELEKRMEVQKEKDARRAEQDKVRQAKEDAAKKIKEEIKLAEKEREGSAEKLSAAAAALKGKKEPVVETKQEETKTPPQEESVAEQIVTQVEETLEDVVDTIKAVAHVVGEKIDEAVERFNEAETERQKTAETSTTEASTDTPTSTPPTEVSEATHIAATEKVEVKENVEKAEAPKVADFAAKDDLKRVEGIGPKIEGLLNAAGINTFSDLENTAVDKVKAILTEAGNRYKAHDPTTWPRQAGMAAAGKWDELQKWQDELDGGKEVKSSKEEE